MLSVSFRMIGVGIPFLCVFFGCTPDILTPSDYIKYVRNPNNGFIERHNHPSGAYIEAFYQPPEYVALTQLRNRVPGDSILSYEIERNSSFYHIFLTIGSESGSPIDELLKKVNDGKQSFEERKQFMLYKAQNCFSLQVNGDSLPCVFYHAQMTGKIENAYHFVVAFEIDSARIGLNQNKDFTLIYTDSIWFQKRFDFAFDKYRIDQSPRLKI